MRWSRRWHGRRAYNQILCSLLVLCAFYARLRWLESNDNRWRVAEWAAYLLGFGALEIVVMYPAAALIYTWWASPVSEPRQSWSGSREKGVLALFIPAAAFAAMHLFLVPKNLADIYTIRVDSKLSSTLWTYVRWALGPSRLEELNVPQWSAAGMTATWLIGMALAAFVLWSLRKGDRAPAFCVAWFLLFLVPVLPLPNHISDYYLTLPSGWFVVASWLGHGASVAIAHRTASRKCAARDGVPGWIHRGNLAQHNLVPGSRRANAHPLPGRRASLRVTSGHGPPASARRQRIISEWLSG